MLKDDLQLATPPAHPSDPPHNNVHPLATIPSPPTTGTKLSLLTLNPRKVQPQLEKSHITTSNLLRWKGLGRQDTFRNKDPKDIKEVEKDLRAIEDTKSESSVLFESGASSQSIAAPAFGEGNIALTLTASRDALKRRKPKNNIVKSNSSFVSRVTPHEQLTKRLAERDAGGTFAFVNVGRSFQWLDLSSPTKAEPLTKILFTKAHMLCHDVNHFTKDESHIDVVMGSSASDIIWYEPTSQKYARINKNGVINPSPVRKIKWIPGSENLFAAAHEDGSFIVYDKEKEDAPFVCDLSEDGIVDPHGLDDTVMAVLKSISSPNQRVNPVAYWRIAPSEVKDFAFSPDNRYLAVVCEDKHLRTIDYLKEKMTDVYQAAFGGINCVCWSPDGKYIVTGGEDDTVCIWSRVERVLVARCNGHKSFVTGVAFDPWRSDDKIYRFGSVGLDLQLLLWDFSVGMLNRPKGAGPRIRGSVSAASVRNRGDSVNNLSSLSLAQAQEDQDPEPEFIWHEYQSPRVTPTLPPIMSKEVDTHPLCSIAFEQDSIIVACEDGHVRQWERPGRELGVSMPVP